jgi:hypothetical protein
MGKPRRIEQLAEYYLRAAGVAAVWIDVEGQRVTSAPRTPPRSTGKLLAVLKTQTPAAKGRACRWMA